MLCDQGPTVAEEIRKGSHGGTEARRACREPRTQRAYGASGMEEGSGSHAAESVRNPTVPLAPAHATRKRFHDAASVPSVSRAREHRSHADADPVRPGPGPCIGDPDLTTKSTKDTKKQRTRGRGGRQVDSPFGTDRSWGRDTDHRSVSPVRPVPNATSTKAPPADAGADSAGPNSR